jgi:putative ABC transport system substrate-binding protein
MRTDLQARRISAVIKSEGEPWDHRKDFATAQFYHGDPVATYKSRNRNAMVCQITDGRLDVNVESVSATGKCGLQMNTRRRLVLGLMAGALTVPHASFAQQPAKSARIGFLAPASPQVLYTRLQAFRDGLRELGYVEGKNLQLEVRWGEGKLERLPTLAAELVQANVDVIVAATSPAVVAAHEATRTVPIVMPVSSDPVGDGLVASLARPGGNITGLSLMAPELGQKRLQLLQEIFPKLSHAVAVLWNPTYVGMRARFEQAQVAAPAVGLTVRSAEVRDTRELEAAFEAIIREHPDGLLLLVDPFTLSQRARIVEFAVEQRLPAIYESSDFVDVGGLISYGPNINDMYRRSATYVDKILRGAKPADLPIEQPTKFELVISMRAAKALGTKFPDSILLSADKVIE